MKDARSVSSPATFDALETSNPVGLTVRKDQQDGAPMTFQKTLLQGAAWALVIAALLAPQVSTAQATCGSPPEVVFDDGFRDRSYPPPVSAPPPVTLPPEATPLAVQITTPAPGFTTSRSDVEVLGTFAGPPNTGIRINGRTPFIDGNQFVLPALSLPPGASSIDARVVSMSGATQSATTSVAVDPGAVVDLVAFNADRAGGFAPMAITFSWTTTTPTTFARLEVDFDDNGTFEIDTTDLSAQLRYVYINPGVYRARVRLTTPPPESTTHVATRTVVSVNSNYTRSTLCYLFERMRARLTASDVPGALQALHPTLRPDFDTFWTANLAMLPTIAAQLGTIADGVLGRDSAQLMVTRPVAAQNEPDAFFANFEADADGVWRISGM